MYEHQTFKVGSGIGAGEVDSCQSRRKTPWRTLSQEPERFQGGSDQNSKCCRGQA